MDPTREHERALPPECAADCRAAMSTDGRARESGDVRVGHDERIAEPVRERGESGPQNDRHVRPFQAAVDKQLRGCGDGSKVCVTWMCQSASSRDGIVLSMTSASSPVSE